MAKKYNFITNHLILWKFSSRESLGTSLLPLDFIACIYLTHSHNYLQNFEPSQQISKPWVIYLFVVPRHPYQISYALSSVALEGLGSSSQGVSAWGQTPPATQSHLCTPSTGHVTKQVQTLPGPWS